MAQFVTSQVIDSPVLQTADPVRKPPTKQMGMFDHRMNIGSLTSLRFFLCLALVFYHAREYFTCLPDAVNGIAFTHFVTFFFVLSGFVLTLNYFNLSGISSAIQFLIARFARIWPAHLFTLLLLVFMVPEVFKVTNAKAPVFYANMFMLHGYVPLWSYYFSFNASSWSNSTEYMFYLAFPLLLIAMKKRWYLPILYTAIGPIALVALCNYLHLSEFDPVNICSQGLMYINPFSRVVEFAVGMVAAFFYGRFLCKYSPSRVLATLLEIVLIAGIIWLAFNTYNYREFFNQLIGANTSYWILNNIVPVPLTVCLILIFTYQRGLLSSMLSNAVFVTLGEISFGVYMLHCVILAYRSINYPHCQSTLDCVLFYATLFVTAHLMHLALETPMRRTIVGLGKLLNAKANTQSLKDKLQTIFSQASLKGLDFKIAALEVAILIPLIYFGLPAANVISANDADKISATSPEYAHVLEYKNGLSEVFAEASRQNEHIQINLLWKVKEAQVLDGSVVIQALDKSGNELSYMIYAQDMRRSALASGAYFQEKINMKLAQAQAVNSIKITLRDRKKRALSYSSPGLPDGQDSYSLIVR